MSTTPKPVAPKAVAPKVAKQPSAKALAYKAKRAARMTELKTKDPIRYANVISFKEAKEAKIVTDWKTFCEFKAKACSDAWLARAKKPVGGEKAVERKKARYEKLKAMLAELEKQIG